MRRDGLEEGALLNGSSAGVQSFVPDTAAERFGVGLRGRWQGPNGLWRSPDAPWIPSERPAWNWPIIPAPKSDPGRRKQRPRRVFAFHGAAR